MAGQASKRPSPLWLVPLGRRAGTGGGRVGEDTGASTRHGPPPRPCASVHRPKDAKRGMPSLFVFRPIWVFWDGGGGGGGLPKGLGQNVLVQFSSLGSSITKIFKTDFFDIMTIHDDQITDVKHVLAPLCVSFKEGPRTGVLPGGPNPGGPGWPRGPARAKRTSRPLPRAGPHKRAPSVPGRPGAGLWDSVGPP